LIDSFAAMTAKTVQPAIIRNRTGTVFANSRQHCGVKGNFHLIG
jgi:hypothetical protein